MLSFSRDSTKNSRVGQVGNWGERHGGKTVKSLVGMVLQLCVCCSFPPKMSSSESSKELGATVARGKNGWGTCTIGGALNRVIRVEGGDSETQSGQLRCLLTSYEETRKIKGQANLNIDT